MSDFAEAFWAEYPRDVVMVEGVDALSYLHSQVSQDLQPLAVGASAWTLLLEPTGKVDVLARVLRSGDTAYVLDVDAGSGDMLIARLMRFKIRVKAEVSVIPWSCIAVRGIEAGSVAPSAGGIAVVTWWSDPSIGVDLLGPAPQPPAGVRPGTAEELERERIAAAWPAMGSEITEATIPGETGLADVAVSFTKGCYPGQELVERMDSRGAGAPRRLVALTVADGAHAGDPIVIDGTEVGVLTSVAGELALGSVRRSVADEAITNLRHR
ncbi:MAG: folate-binding protein YgfZ [Acidimicrobiia bacterium]